MHALMLGFTEFSFPFASLFLFLWAFACSFNYAQVFKCTHTHIYSSYFMLMLSLIIWVCDFASILIISANQMKTLSNFLLFLFYSYLICFLHSFGLASSEILISDNLVHASFPPPTLQKLIYGA